MIRLRLLTAGESHGPELVVILDGMPAGLVIDARSDIDPDLARRQGRAVTGDGGAYRGASARMRVERDVANIVGGVLAGRTTGGPVAVRVVNADHNSWKGKALPPISVPRPGHADLAGVVKFGHDDIRLTIERASARETAARVVAGAICRRLIAELGVRVGSYVTAIGPVKADVSRMSLAGRVDAAATSLLCCPCAEATGRMEEFLEETMRAGDTAGGTFDVVALGAPPGLGSYTQWDQRLSSQLAAAIVSIPAVGAVEIGEALANAARPGTEVHGDLALDPDSRVRRIGASGGGIEGGISTGEPIWIRAAMKPIATTVRPHASIDLASGALAATEYQRSDFCAVPRAAVVGEAMVCLVLADALLVKLGGDSLDEIRMRAAALRQGRIGDFTMRAGTKVFWP
jgi:chorismate synthase